MADFFSILEVIGVWRDIIVALIIILLFLLARNLFMRFIFNIIIRFANKKEMQLDKNILMAFHGPLKTLILVIGVYLSLVALPMSDGFYLLLYPIHRSLIIFLVAWGLYNLTRSNTIKEISEKYAVDKILIDFFMRVLRVLLVILAAVMTVQTWGYNVEGFLAGLGLGGLAFALAAQDTVANIFGGIMIIIDKPVTVEEMTFRSTKVRTFANALVTVPNSVIANQALTNWTRMGKRRITFHLGVTYTTPIEKLKSCVERIRITLENHPDINKETIFVRFDRFSESSMDIFLYFFTDTTKWSEYLRTKEDINFTILEILNEESVSLAFPSRSIYLESTIINSGDL